ncbi:hypothetical protein GTO27_06415 [Candidatus Bathyarchaeota archaeon]|nr:hypothetical protein [Candidatus Bathyarchaeota archaeon]
MMLTEAYALFVVYLNHENNEVKTMNLNRGHSIKADHHSQLREWVRHVILEAQKNNDFEKKSRFTRLLKDL